MGVSRRSFTSRLLRQLSLTSVRSAVVLWFCEVLCTSLACRPHRCIRRSRAVGGWGEKRRWLGQGQWCGYFQIHRLIKWAHRNSTHHRKPYEVQRTPRAERVCTNGGRGSLSDAVRTALTTTTRPTEWEKMMGSRVCVATPVRFVPIQTRLVAARSIALPACSW